MRDLTLVALVCVSVLDVVLFSVVGVLCHKFGFVRGIIEGRKKKHKSQVIGL